MSKQDRQGVRTAAELERKYDLKAITGLKKAVRLSEETINKTNKILEDFIVSTLGSIENIQNQLDGNITTYFYSGVPTLENLPASEWITDELKNNHVGDLYYDQDTGYAYRFVYSDGAYIWLELADNDVAEALAMANAAKDTADNKRRVFTDTPYPPYDNGDLWLNNLEIYVCQISKGKDEVYEDNDFIVATKYTDNTEAIRVGDELQILKGTVTTIKENADSFKIEVTETTEELRTATKSTEDKLNEIDEELRNQIIKFQKYFTFNINGLIIGQVDNPFKVIIDNDRYSMTVNDVEVLWLDAVTGEVHTPEITITRKMTKMGYVEELDEEGRLNTIWVGDE